MAEFRSQSCWKKASYLLTHIAYMSFLVLLVTPGWSSAGPGLVRCDRYGRCGRDWYLPTEAMVTIAYLCALPAIVLSECIMWLDEVKSNRVIPIVCLCFNLAAGAFLFLADVFYISQLDSYPLADTETILTAFVFISAGICTIINLTGVKVPLTKK